MRSAGAPVTSPITCDMRIRVPFSMPFARDTSVASPGSSERHEERLERRVWLGTPKTTISAPSRASSADDVARSDSGRAIDGR